MNKPTCQLAANLAKNLRAHRESLGLSQEKFADLLGYDRTYIGGLERAERNPSLAVVEQLANQIGKEPLGLLNPSVSQAK